MGRHVGPAPALQTFHSKTPGRHAAQPATHPANLAAITGALFAVATSGATPQTIPDLQPLETGKIATLDLDLTAPEVTAAEDAVLTEEHPAMGSEAAPPPDPVATTVATPVATDPTPAVQPVVAAQAGPRHLAPPATPPAHVQAPTAAPAPSLKGPAIVRAALAQLGAYQDCTMLATRSLAAVGIAFHGWPWQYQSLGYIVPASMAQPGDLAYYADGGMGVPHIAVYIGNGMAVHGGWGGNRTVEFSVNVGSGPAFIHIP